MYIAKNIWDYRLKEIATAFGLRHYGAVANAIFMVANKLVGQPEINLKINAIIKRPLFSSVLSRMNLSCLQNQLQSEHTFYLDFLLPSFSHAILCLTAVI